MSDTTAERSRRYRERRAGRLPPVPECPACGITHTGKRGPLCSRCWERLTPEGRKYKADRVARAYWKKKGLQPPA